MRQQRPVPELHLLPVLLGRTRPIVRSGMPTVGALGLLGTPVLPLTTNLGCRLALALLVVQLSPPHAQVRETKPHVRPKMTLTVATALGTTPRAIAPISTRVLVNQQAVVPPVTTTVTTTQTVVVTERRVRQSAGMAVATTAVLGRVQMVWGMRGGLQAVVVPMTATLATARTTLGLVLVPMALHALEPPLVPALTTQQTAGMKLGAHGRPLLMRPSHQSHPTQTVPIGYTTTAQAVQTSISFRQEQTP